MKSPQDHDILVIDLTNRCFLKCSNCTRDVAHQSKTNEMTPDTFRKALASLKGWWRPGRVIGLIGGEPTLNKHFAEICRIFRDEFNPGALKHGREPIKDFNAFANERLFDRTNGKGLWTSFGPRFTDYYELVMETFSHWNPNDHTGGGVHQTSLVDAREMMQALGLPWEEWPKYRDACWLQNNWSASITPSGKAYFCERAAVLDQLYNDGQLGWDVETEPEWWRRGPEAFGEQLSICEMCSMALPGPSQVDAVDRDIISERHRTRLQMVGSPAVRAGRYELFDPQKHTQRRSIESKDNYVEGPRVSPDNEYIYGKKVTCVVTCVGRAEHLEKTLPHNAKLVDKVIVVRVPQDEGMDDLFAYNLGPTYGSKVDVVSSDRMHEGGAAFNKGALINDGLACINDPDWVILTDADVFLNPKLPEFLKTHALNPGVLYGTRRCDSTIEPKTWTEAINNFMPGWEALARGVNAEPNGFFQLFNRRANSLRHRTWPNIMPENFCSAGGVDSWLFAQFSKER